MDIRGWLAERSTGEQIVIAVGVGGVALVGLVAVGFVAVALLGTFVLGAVEPEVQQTPQVDFDYDFDREAGTVEILHAGGDSLRAGENTGRVVVTAARPGTDEVVWIGNGNEAAIRAGDRITYQYGEPGTVVQVVWDGPDGEMSAPLGSQQAPA